MKRLVSNTLRDVAAEGTAGEVAGLIKKLVECDTSAGIPADATPPHATDPPVPPLTPELAAMPAIGMTSPFDRHLPALKMAIMRIERLVWPEERVEHIARHGVTPGEVEHVCFSTTSLVLRSHSAGQNPV